jgi:hypothetical protein
MSYYIRQKDSENIEGPFKLDEIEARIPASIDIALTYYAPAKGQSMEALRTITRWDPLSTLLDQHPEGPAIPLRSPELPRDTGNTKPRYKKERRLIDLLGKIAVRLVILVWIVAILLPLMHGFHWSALFDLFFLGWTAVFLITCFFLITARHVALVVIDMAEAKK